MRRNMKVVTKLEQKKENWDRFFRDDSSNMLEDALPYLPASLKKTAAVYIKFTELIKIMQQFDQQETLSACGLDEDHASLELLLNAMKLRAPKETAAQINQLLQMMQMMRFYQTYQSLIQSNPSLASSVSKATENNDMLTKLMPLLMQQNQNPKTSSVSDTPNHDFLNQLNQILNK